MPQFKYACIPKSTVATVQAIKAFRQSTRVALLILNLALDGGEWSASRSGRFTASTHLTEGWVCPRESKDVL